MAHHVADCDFEKQTIWGIEIGFRYGALLRTCTLDIYYNVRVGSPYSAFLGNSAINLHIALNQIRRWSVGLLEVAFCRYSPIAFEVKYINLLQGLCYADFAFLPILSIPITIYAFVLNSASISIFPKRMWAIAALSCFTFGLMEYLLKLVGISTFGFSVTSKVVEAEESKRYNQGIFEFGVSSPFVLTNDHNNSCSDQFGFISIWHSTSFQAKKL